MNLKTSPKGPQTSKDPWTTLESCCVRGVCSLVDDTKSRSKGSFSWESCMFMTICKDKKEIVQVKGDEWCVVRECSMLKEKHQAGMSWNCTQIKGRSILLSTRVKKKMYWEIREAKANHKWFFNVMLKSLDISRAKGKQWKVLSKRTGIIMFAL